MITTNSRTDVLLIYPYFHREPGWRGLWLFPPLGLGYLARVLRKNGIKVRILDGTFMQPEELIKKAEMLSPGIVGYPGETGETILKTLRFSSRLPADYLSYTLPYPLPGTGLYNRLANRLTKDEWKIAGHNLLMFKSDFSQMKLRFAIYKGMVEHRLWKYGLSGLASIFEGVTDSIFRIMR